MSLESLVSQDRPSWIGEEHIHFRKSDEAKRIGGAAFTLIPVIHNLAEDISDDMVNAIRLSDMLPLETVGHTKDELSVLRATANGNSKAKQILENASAEKLHSGFRQRIIDAIYGTGISIGCTDFSYAYLEKNPQEISSIIQGVQGVPLQDSYAAMIASVAVHKVNTIESYLRRDKYTLSQLPKVIANANAANARKTNRNAQNIVMLFGQSHTPNLWHGVSANNDDVKILTSYVNGHEIVAREARLVARYAVERSMTVTEPDATHMLVESILLESETTTPRSSLELIAEAQHLLAYKLRKPEVAVKYIKDYFGWTE